MLKQVLYVSRASDGLAAQDIRTILDQSRRNNAPQGVSGILLHAEQLFLQLLEGPPAVMNATLTRIVHDPRHRGLITLMERHVPAPAFAGWAMGFRQLDPGVPEERTAFELSREALGQRLSGEDATILDIVLAFAGQDFLRERVAA